MLKIGKGLKKKKKSKKNKHKEEELFTEEELEQYRREHQLKAAQESEEQGTAGETSEELQKFKLLTAGVDDVLRETQGRLDRIKKESYFQRKPTPSDLKAQEERERELQKQTKGNWIGFEEREEESKEEDKAEQREEESESEYEFDDNDDLFDTTYVDVIASGGIKLAYVPDDEDQFDEGPDPFDTSNAEEVLKRVEEEEQKKKKQISLGVAVEVLTGRAERDKSILEESGLAVEAEEPAVVQQVNKPRKRPRKIQDFSLLGSFDEGSSAVPEGEAAVPEVPPCGKSLLDDDLVPDCELPTGNVLITEILAKQTKKEVAPVETDCDKGATKGNLETLLDEFDVVKENTSLEVKKLEEEDDFDEFTALAASSVANQKLEEELTAFEDSSDDPFDTSAANRILKEDKTDDLFGSIEGEVPAPETIHFAPTEGTWSAFEEEKKPVDPFDTTFVDEIQPGKCELKLLENEILGDTPAKDIHQEARILSRSDSDFDFNPREESHAIPESILKAVQSKVSIQITDPSGAVETQRSSISENSESNFQQLTAQQRDLLGGSTSDLSKLGDDPLPPNVESPVEDFSKYTDPFDTSIVERVAAPGKAELKFIEKELLSDIPPGDVAESINDDEDDDDFDPRAEEKSSQKVTFAIPPGVDSDLLSSIKEEGARPLTPFYPEPLPGDADAAEEADTAFDFSDPFDTSHVVSLPGKVEIKLIEKELESVEAPLPVVVPVHEKLGITQENQSALKHSLSDQDFNPRGEEEEEAKVEETPATSRRYSDVTGLARKPPTSLPLKRDKPDLFVVEEEHPVKALTPAVEEDVSSYVDPFDTSIAENIAPGKAELKVLEGELIVNAEGGIKRSYTDPDFNPRDEIKEPDPHPQGADVLSLPAEVVVTAKPLTPLEFEKGDNSEDVDGFDDADPFDTSIASNLLPGRAELRILESELIGQ